jgi:hypothetical protein
MYKKFLFFSAVIFLSAGLRAQQSATRARRIDTVAVAILDRMSAIIGDLGSCSFTVRSNYDISSKELGLIKHSDEEHVYLHGPNKLMMRSDGDQGSHELYFDGTKLSYYSVDRNQYGQIDAALSLVEMIDTVNKSYGIEFPAADFLYPSFVDDVLGDSKELVYLGLTKVDGKDCYHIAGKGPDKTFQFWISDDAFSLPVKMVIVYTDKEMNPQYEATLSDWQVNPNLPDAIFEFTAPHKARKIKMMLLSAKK